MKAAWEKFPKDADIGALYAESLMNLRPWDLWTADGKPQPETPEIIATLEAVLKVDPDHPLALHLYIHAMEASPEPGKADDAADRLRELHPALGPPGSHAVAHRHAPRPVAGGGRGQRDGHRRRRRVPEGGRRSRASTACTWRTTTTCWRSPR